MKRTPKTRWSLSISLLVVLLAGTIVWQAPNASGKSTAKAASRMNRLRRLPVAP